MFNTSQYLDDLKPCSQRKNNNTESNSFFNIYLILLDETGDILIARDRESK